MGPTNSRPAELALPVASLAALRRALAASVGPDGAAHALRAAGHAAGDAFFRALCRTPSHTVTLSREDAAEALRGLDERTFWNRLSGLFAARGWGTLVHEPLHAGLGSLSSPEWVESDPETAAARPSCFFSTGLLANLLGQVAAEDVAVLEVECRSQGDARCRFVFGGPATLETVFHELEGGRDFHGTIAALT